MKIALKYGLLITAGVIAWLVIAHTLFPDPAAAIHRIGPAVFFNLLEITGIALGIRAKQREMDGVLLFKTGIKTGVAIAFVYGVTTSLFFVIQLAVFGPVWLAPESRAPGQPLWQAALGAFVGLLIFAIVLGLIYSTIVSFVVVRAQRGHRYD
jgi:hypothetical protein